MSDIQIREIRSEEDYNSIYEISSRSWEPIYSYRKTIMDSNIFFSLYGDGPLQKATQVKDWCIKNPEKVRLAELKGNVVGFITWSVQNKEVVELCNNAVDPSAHRQGVASSLYSWFFKHMKEEGFLYTYVFTGLDPAHEPARKAYEKNGFETPVSNVRYYKKL